MRIFKKNGFEFVCASEGTRYGFRHLCTVFDANGYEVKKCKRCYYNRTWERFTFESVLNDACRALGIDCFSSEEG